MLLTNHLHVRLRKPVLNPVAASIHHPSFSCRDTEANVRDALGDWAELFCHKTFGGVPAGLEDRCMLSLLTRGGFLFAFQSLLCRWVNERSPFMIKVSPRDEAY